jgi:hypothetical protein
MFPQKKQEKCSDELMLSKSKWIHALLCCTATSFLDRSIECGSVRREIHRHRSMGASRPVSRPAGAAPEPRWMLPEGAGARRRIWADAGADQQLGGAPKFSGIGIRQASWRAGFKPIKHSSASPEHSPALTRRNSTRQFQV